MKENYNLAKVGVKNLEDVEERNENRLKSSAWDDMSNASQKRETELVLTIYVNYRIDKTLKNY